MYALSVQFSVEEYARFRSVVRKELAHGDVGEMR
jgi:hypothetical protein